MPALVIFPLKVFVPAIVVVEPATVDNALYVVLPPLLYVPLLVIVPLKVFVPDKVVFEPATVDNAL